MFHLFCGLGPDRTLEMFAGHLYQEQAKPIPSKATILSKLKKWSSAHDWMEKAKKYDAEIIKETTKQHRIKLQAMLDTMNEEQAEEARELRIKAKKVLHKLADNMLNDTEDAPKLYARDAVALYKESVSTERLSLGDVTQRTETELSGNPDKPMVIEAVWGTGSIEGESENE